MRCPKCRTQIENNDVFCPECGCRIEQQFRKEKNRSSKVIPTIVIIFALVLVFCFVGLYRLNKSEEEETERQKAEIEKIESEETEKNTRELEEDSDTVAEDDNKKDEKKDTDIKEEDNTYILPDSNSRYLTSRDIEDLTLRELNYAKNEIYARHGRRFKSQELMNYFQSKSWYIGKYDPDEFDKNYSGNVLNDYEKKNAELLSKREYSLNANGYQLDAN